MMVKVIFYVFPWHGNGSGFYHFTLLRHHILWSFSSFDNFGRMRHSFMPEHTSISQQEERNTQHSRLLKCIRIFIMKHLYETITFFQLNDVHFSLLISWRLVLKWLVERTFQKVFLMYGRRYWNCQSQLCFLSNFFTCGLLLNLWIFYGIRFFKRKKQNVKESLWMEAIVTQRILTSYTLSYLTGRICFSLSS